MLAGGNIHTRGPRDGAESGHRAWSVVAWGTLERKSSMPYRCAATHARTPPLDGLRGLVRFFPSLTMPHAHLGPRWLRWMPHAACMHASHATVRGMRQVLAWINGSENKHWKAINLSTESCSISLGKVYT